MHARTRATNHTPRAGDRDNKWQGNGTSGGLVTVEVMCVLLCGSTRVKRAW
jgi:hypothetical protein